jgi:hypothetical protein
MRMNKAAVGFRVHSGWSAVVVVSLEDGEPVVLRRERVQMVKTFSYAYRQPYHTAEKMELAEAEELTCAALRGLRDELKKLGWQMDRGALLLASGRELPEFAKILASHALIHTADGELFRAAIRGACGRSGVRVMEIRERELVERCAEKFAMREAVVLRRASELGKEFGAPWTQDEKLATLGAWWVLGEPQRSQRHAQFVRKIKVGSWREQRRCGVGGAKSGRDYSGVRVRCRASRFCGELLRIDARQNGNEAAPGFARGNFGFGGGVEHNRKAKAYMAAMVATRRTGPRDATSGGVGPDDFFRFLHRDIPDIPDFGTRIGS